MLRELRVTETQTFWKRMDDSPPTKPDLESTQQQKQDYQTSRKRKAAQKTVITVKIETNNTGKQKGEGPPSDFWSWRKYGQKPIKGSPYPRGYYRCSTSKGCTAKKQVERCRTDPSVVIITYTSDHNHPDPDPSSANPSTTAALHSPSNTERGAPTADNTQDPTKTAAASCEGATSGGSGDPHVQCPPRCTLEDTPKDSEMEMERDHRPARTLSDEGGALLHADVPKSSPAEPAESPEDASPNPATLETEESRRPRSAASDAGGDPSHSNAKNVKSSSGSEPANSSDDNIFDELEELPVPSSVTTWVRSNSFDDRALPLPIPLLDY